MKYLRHDFCLTKSSARWVWADKSVNSGKSSSEKIPDTAFESPFSFDKTHLQEIEKHWEHQTETQKQKLQEIIGYWMTMAQESSDETSLENLMVLKDDYPQIYGELDDFYTKNIEEILSNKKSKKSSSTDLLNTEFQKAQNFLDFAESQDVLTSTHMAVLDEIIDQSVFVEQDDAGNQKKHDFGNRAEVVKEKYIEKLNQRIQDKKLKAADMDLLLKKRWGKNVNNRSETELESIKEKIDKVLAVQNTDEPTYLSHDYDKYSPWFAVPQTKEPENIANLEKAIDDVFGKDLSDTTLADSVKDGLLKHFGDTIAMKMDQYKTENQTKENVEKTLEDENSIEEIIEKEKKKWKAIIDKIEDPMQAKKLWTQFAVREKWLRQGKPGEFPGVDFLKEAQENTKDIAESIKAKTENIRYLVLQTEQLLHARESLKKRIDDFQGRKNEYTKPLFEEKKKQEHLITQNFQNIRTEWKDKKPQIQSAFQDFEKRIDKTGNNKIYKNAEDNYIQPLENMIEILLSVFTEKEMEVGKENQLFQNVGQKIDDLNNFSSLGGRFWNAFSQAALQDFEKGSEDVQFLAENDFFSDSEKSKLELQKIQADYAQKVDKYAKKHKEIIKKIRKDLSNDSDEDFHSRYKGRKKEEVRETVDAAEKDLEDFLEQWKEAKKTKNIQDLFQKYPISTENLEAEILKTQDPQKQKALREKRDRIESDKARAIDKVGMIRKLEEDVQGMSQDTEKMDTLLKNDNKQRQGEMWGPKVNEFFSSGWYFYSLNDVYQVIKTSFQALKRKEERRSEQAQARLGTQFWEGLGSRILQKDAALIASEFNRRKEEADKKRVDEYELAYTNKKPSELWAIVGRKNSNVDEVAACLNKLNELGALRFDDPILWKFVNRMKRFEYMKFPEDLQNMTLTDITAKVGTVLSEVYSQKDFDTWSKTREDKQVTAMKEWTSDFSIAASEGLIHQKFVEMLHNWKEGNLDEVNPARFLAYLKESFDEGKASGFPDYRFYYLIQAVTLKNPKGQTILGRDVFDFLNSYNGAKLLTRIPFFEFFLDEGEYKLNGKIVPKGTPGAEKRAWRYTDFMAWADFMGDAGGTFNPQSDTRTQKRVGQFFDYYVAQSSQARGRVGRMTGSSAKEADHDDAWMYVRGWSPDSFFKIIYDKSFKSKDFLRTFFAAIPDYMKNMYDYIQEGDREYKDVPEWQNTRKSVLKQVGSRLHMTLLGLQTLSGNVFPEGERSKQVIFDKDVWNGTGMVGVSLLEGREKVYDFMFDLCDVAEENGRSVDHLRQMVNQKGYEISTIPRTLFDFAKKRGPYEKYKDEKGFKTLEEKEEREEFLTKSKAQEAAIETSAEFLRGPMEPDDDGGLFGNVAFIEEALNRFIKKV